VKIDLLHNQDNGSPTSFADWEHNINVTVSNGSK